MRITFVNPVGVIGGGERVLLAALRALPDALAGFTPTVLLLAEGPLGDAAAQLGAAVRVCPLPARAAQVGDAGTRNTTATNRFLRLAKAAFSSGPAVAAFLPRLHAALRATRPDHIHSNGLKAHLLLAAAAPRKVPVTWHLHDFAGDRPAAGRLLAWAARGRVRGGVAISEAVRCDTLRLAPRLAVTTVFNAVDTNNFSPDGAEADLATLAGLPPVKSGVVQVGLIATYADWKGHKVFLRALANVAVPVRGYIIGGPIYQTAGSQVTRAELVELARSLGVADRVGFVPFQSDPAGVYRALDIVVHASTRPEPFGLTIAEAMSCGRAVVVSAAGGAAELFTPDETALGHAPGDVGQLTTAIQTLAMNADLRARLGRAARNQAESRFGLTRFGAELATVFRGGR